MRVRQRFSKEVERFRTPLRQGVDATNEKDPNAVTVKERDMGAVQNGFPVEFPPHSLTAFVCE